MSKGHDVWRCDNCEYVTRNESAARAHGEYLHHHVRHESEGPRVERVEIRSEAGNIATFFLHESGGAVVDWIAPGVTVTWLGKAGEELGWVKMGDVRRDGDVIVVNHDLRAEHV